MCTCMPLCTGLVILMPWLHASNLSIVNSGPVFCSCSDGLLSRREEIGLIVPHELQFISVHVHVMLVAYQDVCRF